MSESEKAGATRSPAEVYEEFFVPALFQQWGSVVVNAAGVGPDQRVLDVACSTGVLACAAVDRVGLGGAVVGLDPSDEMLTVARRKNATIEWRVGRAESVPFPNETFDAVVSQFGLMFFEDPRGALREMMRVLRPGGRLAVAVCDSLDHSPGYTAFVELLLRLFGDRVANAFRAPFVLGDPQLLLSLCADRGFSMRKSCSMKGWAALRPLIVGLH
jgi:ubiquinone/menaquinone biosynthesis C-methylase UbiE